MQAILIAMTILGCDDGVTQCTYLASPEKRWESVAQCDGESEKRLKAFSNVHYPTVIAVCQPFQIAQKTEPPTPQPATPPVIADPQPQPSHGIAGFTSRSIEQARQMLPSRDGIKNALVKPVHFVSDGYSWVARRLAN